jgi:plastocyanin
MPRMRIPAAALALTLALAPAEGGSAIQPAVAVAQVRIANFTFSPAVLHVKIGTTVAWTNDDDVPHSVVAVGGSFKSKVLDSGDRFSFTFGRAGEFRYFCSIHPHMTGKIQVEAAG